MDIEFVWNQSTTTVNRDTLESKIREDIESDDTLVPCHPGKITIYFSPTDPLEVTINGRLVCQCGHDFGTFSGAPNGSPLRYKSMHLALGPS
jgi:hypothetical protein